MNDHPLPRRPTSLTVHQRTRVLEVGFDDGAAFRIPFELMRIYSPSAEVQGHGPGQEILQTGKREVEVVSLEPVGNYAVADRETKTVVRLLHTPSTDNNSVHLSPGAVIVLVEETAPGSPLPRKTGQLVVYDARTGAPIKTFEDPRIDGTFYRGMAPTGIALYQNMERTVFVDLGMTFPAEAVVVARRPDFVGPAVFFSDR